MAENVFVPLNSGKKEKYEAIIPQVKALVTGEPDLVANLGNVCAVLKEVFDFFWVGFYLLKDDELVLGPFQGALACTRIAVGKGVCGMAAAQKTTLLVPDVNKFSDHIACSTQSKSEVVIPILRADQLLGVLDVDSDSLDDFDEVDVKYLEVLMQELVAICFS